MANALYLIDAGTYLPQILSGSELLHHIQAQYKDKKDELRARLVVEEGTVILNRQEGLLIIEMFVDEILSRLLHYRVETSHTHEIGKLLSPHTSVDNQIELAEMFLELDDIDCAYIMLTNEISNNLNGKPWAEISIHRHRDTLALVQGKDHRAYMYEEQQKENARNNTPFQVDIRNDLIRIANLGRKQFHMPIEQIPYRHMFFKALGNELLGRAQLESRSLRDIVELDDTHPFYTKIVLPQVRLINSLKLEPHFTEKRFYKVIVEPHDYLQVIPLSHGPNINLMRARLIEKSIQNGDWIQESDRRWLDDYKIGRCS